MEEEEELRERAEMFDNAEHSEGEESERLVPIPRNVREELLDFLQAEVESLRRSIIEHDSSIHLIQQRLNQQTRTAEEMLLKLDNEIEELQAYVKNEPAKLPDTHDTRLAIFSFDREEYSPDFHYIVGSRQAVDDYESKLRKIAKNSQKLIDILVVRDFSLPDKVNCSDFRDGVFIHHNMIFCEGSSPILRKKLIAFLTSE